MGEGDWSQNLCEVLSKKINEKSKGAWKNWHFFNLKLDMPNGFMTNWVTP